MKAIKLFLTALVISLFITSCNHQKTELFKSTSKDRNLTLSVWGERVGSIEPWKVYIVADFNSQKDTIFTELHADGLNTKNVQFKWNNNTHCTVKLTHRDGQVNQVPVIFQVAGKKIN